MQKVGRNPTSIKLLPATKTLPTEKIKQAFLSGENKIQELQQKHEKHLD